MKRVLIMILALVMAAMLFASCSKSDEQTTKENTTTEASKDDKKEETKESTTEQSKENKEDKKEETSKEETKKDDKKEAELRQAIDFTLKGKGDKEISLSDYKGKIIFVNFFTTWCQYCKKEMPDLEKLSKQYPDDLQILLVDVFTSEQGSKEQIYKWHEDLGLSMPMVLDEENKAAALYPVQGFPTTYIIDKDFNVLGYLPGMITEKDGKKIIEGILNDK